ncbi:hypothetical protein PVAP13_3KG085227 [Panicum virgatum]|uniref:Uncharacterized protein n=1 Tax=Panicum virgatum TaxID=38727 RepID=A0A8T0UIJ7_PANVG|nr:hypothetical protein PVAP13_3KG085227 [Panicum virgatum]
MCQVIMSTSLNLHGNKLLRSRRRLLPPSRGRRLYGLAKSEPIKAMDPGAVIKAALGSRSSDLEPSHDSKHKQLSSSELQPASISRAICNRIVHISNIKGTHICDPHDGGPPPGENAGTIAPLRT